MTGIRIDGDRKSAIETGRNRLMVAGALFVAAFAAISVRMIDVSLVRTEETETRRAADIRPSDERANIFDRNGVLLATSVNTASLYADPRKIQDPRRAARRLSEVLADLDRTRIEKKLRLSRNFVWVRRHLTPRLKYEINRLGIPGFDFQNETRRIYPLGGLAAHVVGFTDVDGRGLSGVESYFDKALRSSDESLTLSVDVRVQHALEHELRNAMDEYSAIGAAGLVMDVASGELLAMTSLPDFDPNQPGAIADELRINRATLGVYEMGSTFKIFTTAMALDAGTVTLRGGYDATHPIRVARFTIRDHHPQKRWLSVPEIFIHSSNIGTVKMARAVGTDAHRSFLSVLGMMKPMNIELTEIGAPLSPDRWREINAMTISYGHGLAVSPLHLTAGVSAMVNGGIYRDPTLLRRNPGDASEGRRVISVATSEKMRKLLRLAVRRGTGRRAEAKGYIVGGKTGTAEKVSGRGYQRKAMISSFIGAFPMHRPRYVVLAMLDEAKGTAKTHGYATGGWVAAPVVGAVVRRIAPLLGIRPAGDPDAIREVLAIDLRREMKVATQ